MSFKLFDNIGIEDLNENIDTNVDMLDVIAMENDQFEADLVAGQIATGIASMENAIEVAGTLEAKITIEEAIVTAGTATAGIAQLAMVTLQNTAASVGMDANAFAISNESIESNPTTALKVSVESAKETFDKIIKQIKEFFSRMWSKIKKLAAKLMLVIGNFEKKFASLKKAADEITSDLKDGVKDKYTESEGKSIANKLFRALSEDNGALKVGELTKKQAKEVVAKKTTYVKDLIAVLETAKEGDLSKQTDVTMEITDLNQSYDGLPSALTNTDLALVGARFDGTTVSGFKVTADVKEIGKNQYTMVKFTSFRGTAKKDLVAKYAKDISVLKVDEIKTLVAAGASLATQKETLVKYADEILSTTDKAIAKKPKAKEEADQDRLDSLYASTLSTVNTNALKFSSDLLLGYVAGLRNMAWLAQISIAKYKPKAK